MASKLLFLPSVAKVSFLNLRMITTCCFVVMPVVTSFVAINTNKEELKKFYENYVEKPVKKAIEKLPSFENFNFIENITNGSKSVYESFNSQKETVIEKITTLFESPFDVGNFKTGYSSIKTELGKMYSTTKDIASSTYSFLKTNVTSENIKKLIFYLHEASVLIKSMLGTLSSMVFDKLGGQMGIFSVDPKSLSSTVLNMEMLRAIIENWTEFKTFLGDLVEVIKLNSETLKNVNNEHIKQVFEGLQANKDNFKKILDRIHKNVEILKNNGKMGSFGTDIDKLMHAVVVGSNAYIVEGAINKGLESLKNRIDSVLTTLGIVETGGTEANSGIANDIKESLDTTKEIVSTFADMWSSLSSSWW